jgi:hypothetical protein
MNEGVDEMHRFKAILIVLMSGMVLLTGTFAWSDEDSLRKAKELNPNVTGCDKGW